MAHLYTILFSNGLIKIGMTKGKPKSRLATHLASLGVAQIDVVDYEFAECNPANMADAEKLLIERCKKHQNATQRSKEWFYGLHFEDVKQWMREYVDPKNFAKDENPKPSPMEQKEESLLILADQAKQVIKLAAVMSKADEYLAEIIFNGLDKNRQAIVCHCWKFMAEHENKDIQPEEFIDLLAKDVSELLYYDFLLKA